MGLQRCHLNPRHRDCLVPIFRFRLLASHQYWRLRPAASRLCRSIRRGTRHQSNHQFREQLGSSKNRKLAVLIFLIYKQTDYGGMQAYCTYYGIALTDWYTSAAAQAQYQTYIAAVVSRYKTSTAIFAWELANEPRCTGCATSVITTWATTTSAYIKSLDPNHMVRFSVSRRHFGPLQTSHSWDCLE